MPMSHCDEPIMNYGIKSPPILWDFEGFCGIFSFFTSQLKYLWWSFSFPCSFLFSISCMSLYDRFSRCNCPVLYNSFFRIFRDCFNIELEPFSGREGQRLLGIPIVLKEIVIEKWIYTLYPLVSSSSNDPISKASAALTSPRGGVNGGVYFCM